MPFCSGEFYNTNSNGALLGNQVTPKRARRAVNGLSSRESWNFDQYSGPIGLITYCCAVPHRKSTDSTVFLIKVSVFYIDIYP